MDQLELSVSAAADVPSIGKIAVRFVVFRKKALTQAPVKPEADLMPDDETEGAGQEINSYLESSSRGRQHVVFLLSGQRHHSLDRGFIVHELGKKYISKRTLITVELEGLTREAKSQLIQGSRNGFYEGEVFHRIRNRLVALLKKDPDLERLEEEAEEDLSRLQATDEAVSQALDQLIEEHNPLGDHATDGTESAGGKRGALIASAGTPAAVDVVVKGVEGTVVGGPLLVGHKTPKTLRLRPNQETHLALRSEPAEAWNAMQKLGWVMDPPFEELKVTLDSETDGARVGLLFASQNQEEDYPLETTLRLFAAFKSEPEPRLFEQNIVIKPAGIRPTPTPPVLLDEPTVIRLRSRKPIKLLVGDADRHVVFQWDGKDELLSGGSPGWMLRVFSTSHPDYPEVVVTQPQQGRFSAVVPCPAPGSPFTPGTAIIFQVEAVGRAGRTLSIQFETIVEEGRPPVVEAGPRRTATTLPLAADRRPNYRVVEISANDYETTECEWANKWDTTLAGAYIEPSDKAPLTLIVNVDFDLYRSFMAAEIKAKASESAIKRHQTRYLAHLCYYLYQMYLAQSRTGKRPPAGEDAPSEPAEERNVQEVNRVGTMLVRLMQMMH
jgi:hypothetical protein